LTQAKSSKALIDTELKRLRHREARYETIERIAKIGNYEWNYQLDRLESCSKEFANIFELTVEKAISTLNGWDKVLGYIHPDDRDIYRREVRNLRQTKAIDVSYRILLANGEIKHVHEYGTVVADDAGEITGSLSILQDVSEQVKHERELEFRDELAGQAESITDIGHFIFDEINEVYLYISEGFARIHGSTVSAYLSKVQSVANDLEDVFEDDRGRVEEEYRHYMSSGEDCAIEYRLIHGNGKTRWIRELSKAYRRENGRITQTLGVVQDITNRVRQEQELVIKDAITTQAEVLTDIGYFLFDEIENCNIYVSEGQARILGMTVNEYRQKVATNQDFINLTHKEDRQLVKQTYDQNLSNQKDWQIEFRVLHRDGNYRWVREKGKALKINDNQVEQTIGVMQDITEQKKVEQELILKDTLATQAEALTEIGYYIFDEINRVYLFVSPGLGRIYGVDHNEILHDKITREVNMAWIHEDDKPRVKKIYDTFLAKGGEWRAEYRVVRKDGSIRWVRELGKTYIQNRGFPEQTIGVLQDITEQKHSEDGILKSRDTLEQQVVERTYELGNTIKQLQEEIREREKIAAQLDFLANHDALTGLPSLRLCKDRLERSIIEAQRNQLKAAVMFLDLDGFKQVNDSYGHEFGDQVLKVSADRIQAEIRESDTVARIGGDEFLVILSGLPDINIVKRIAGNLIESISKPIDTQQDQVTVSTSIGIALYPDNGLIADDLIRTADKAMYQVKHRGKNNFTFASEI